MKNKFENLQDNFLNCQYLMTWENISPLRNLLDLVAENEQVFVNVKLASWDIDDNGNFIDPPTLWFEAYSLFEVDGRPNAFLLATVQYEASEADEATGVAWPVDMTTQTIQ